MKWSLKLSVGISFTDMSHFLEFLSAILFTAFHIKYVSEISLAN